LIETKVGPEPANQPSSTTISPRPTPGAGWIVSPSYDLLFIANIGWLLLLLPGMSTGTETTVDFWQIYFLTLPHRWVTLLLVLLDPDRRGGRGLSLLLIGSGLFVFVGGVWLGTGAFTCLAVVDYLWNAWHFAAQHAGVLRIYSRKVGAGSEFLERYGVRFFVTYAAIRSAGWATGWLESDETTMSWLRTVDLVVLGVPAALVAFAMVCFNLARLGKTVYLLSVCGLYSGLIHCLSHRLAGWVVVLATASGLFHAVEYLAVVTHYASRRRTVGSEGPFQAMARNWLPYLGIYVAVLGSAGVWLAREDGPAFELWQGLNLWMALVHYAYDGMIWKLRRPETSRALGAEIGPPSSR
jgi:hypothetical protein